METPRRDILTALPELARRISAHTGTERDLEVLELYYGLEGHRCCTLEEAGATLGVTRERSRQLRNRILSRMQDALAGELPELRIPEWITAEAAQLRAILRNGPPVQCEDALAVSLAQRWHKPLEPEARSALPLLLELLGGRALRADELALTNGRRSWSFRSEVTPARMAPIGREIRNALRRHPEGLSWSGLTAAVKLVLGESVRRREVEEVTPLMEELEVTDKCVVRFRFHALLSNSDRAYRVLAEEGAPLHFREIARRINQRLFAAGDAPRVQSAGSMVRRFSSDPRLEPIARSGEWKLREWRDYPSETVVQLVVEALSQKLRPATYDEVEAFVLSRRASVSRSTLSALPMCHPYRIVRTGRGLLALRSWGLSPGGRYRPHGAIDAGVRDVLLALVEQRGSTELPLAEAVREIVRRKSLNESTVRAKLRRERWARIDSRGGVRILTIDLPALEASDAATPPRARWSPVKNRVSALIRHYLESQPERRAPLPEVRSFVRRAGPFNDPAIYRILDEMADVRKQPEGRHVMVTLLPPGEAQRADARKVGRSRTLYCSERNQMVVLVRSADPTRPGEPPATRDATPLVCLDYGAACTAAVCPLLDVPTSEMARRFTEAVQPVANAG